MRRRSRRHPASCAPSQRIYSIVAARAHGRCYDAAVRTALEVQPIAGALGAEISGVDLSKDLSDDAVAAIRRAWLEHLVVFFRDQDLSPARFLAFGRRFGE